MWHPALLRRGRARLLLELVVTGAANDAEAGGALAFAFFVSEFCLHIVAVLRAFGLERAVGVLGGPGDTAGGEFGTAVLADVAVDGEVGRFGLPSVLSVKDTAGDG